MNCQSEDWASSSSRVAWARTGRAAGDANAAQILRLHAGRAETFTIVSDVLVRVPHRPLQTLQLQRTQLVDAGLLDGFEVHGAAVMLPPI